MSTPISQETRMKKYMETVFDSDKPYVFISYSHEKEDVEKVYTLLDELMKRGINFAIDTEYASQQGSWMDKMNNRLKAVACKCMLSFYSKSYVYSRPSLLEQYLRYSQQVTINAIERMKTYTKQKQNELFSKEYLPSIAISLFETKSIIDCIKDKDEEQIKRIKSKQSDWRFDSKSKIYQFFLEGLEGCWNKTVTTDTLCDLADEDKIDSIRSNFQKIITKENEDNVNFSTEVNEIVSMLASFGIVEDAEIKQKAAALFAGITVPVADNKNQISVAPVEKKTESEPTVVIHKEPSGARYRIEGKKYNAIIRVEKENGRDVYIVETGSMIAPEWTVWIGNKMKNEIISSRSVDDDCRVTREVKFDAISAVGRFIKGASTSGAGMLVEKNLVSDVSSDAVRKAEAAEADTQVGEGVPVVEPDVVTVPENAKRYAIKGKKYDAILRVESDNGQDVYVVEKGSRIAYDWDKYVGKSDLERIQKENSVGEDAVLTKDICFSAISTAGKFIKGTSTNGGGMVTEDNLLDFVSNSGSTPENLGKPSVFEYVVNHTDATYNIITLGKKGNMGQSQAVVVACGGVKYMKKTHSQAAGRIDGMKEIYECNGIMEGDRLLIDCDPENKIVKIEKMVEKAKKEGLGSLLD